MGKPTRAPGVCVAGRHAHIRQRIVITHALVVSASALSAEMGDPDRLAGWLRPSRTAASGPFPCDRNEGGVFVPMALGTLRQQLTESTHIGRCASEVHQLTGKRDGLRPHVAGSSGFSAAMILQQPIRRRHHRRPDAMSFARRTVNQKQGAESTGCWLHAVITFTCHPARDVSARPVVADDD